jgi:hypothetical protein
MDGFRLSEGELEERAAEGSFERGVEYHEAKAVLSVIARGKHVQARVSGSNARPYRVELAGAEGDELGRVSCSCPDDREGWCKHVVAVLLAIRGGDEALEQRGMPETEIGELSVEELRNFVEGLASSRSEVLPAGRPCAYSRPTRSPQRTSILDPSGGGCSCSSTAAKPGPATRTPEPSAPRKVSRNSWS